MDDSRRSFLRWCIHGMGAVFAAVLGVPAIMYLIDPRNRPAAASDLRPVQGVRPSDLVVNDARQGVIRNIRQDGWTLHPNDVVGRVWVRRKAEGDSKDSFVVWTTTCPHLGCSINLNADPATGFTCPCHNAQFDTDGTRVERPGFTNAAPRGMDSLEFEIAADPEIPSEKIFLVRFERFIAGESTKKAAT